ncbi:hypothetical protein MtrunA17_Chr3g0103651 [Medicago truncatula]|uniref:Uncharacterized protein n=1 Tax=Medicago truncatula TaxID=3880 RepID=A0A072UWC0_MEDTR|nr:hypothetical protein MTR_3g462080 [Medicago truncatula]RHN67528.1 hypothetical protein MtrunA17_Chr3g0103651 [Medicago truncatula]
MSDGDGVVDIKDGVRDLVLEDVENVVGDGVNAEYFPPVITREMRVMLTPPLVFSPELRETFSRHWFEKGMEGGSPPSLAFFIRNGLGQIFDIAQDCFNRGSFQASNSASGHVAASTRATTD